MPPAREDLEALFGECDLVLIVPTAGSGILTETTNVNPWMVSAGGDIDLLMSIWSTKISKPRDWRLPTATVRRESYDNTAVETYVTNHPLAPRVARGYRILYVDVAADPALTHSWSIDPENDWIEGAQIWCANPLTEQIKLEFYDGSFTGTLLHTEVLPAGTAAYVDVSAFVESSVRILAHYWDADDSEWRTEALARIYGAVFDAYGTAPATLLASQGHQPHRYSLYKGGPLPWPHVAGG